MYTGPVSEFTDTGLFLWNKCMIYDMICKISFLGDYHEKKV